MKKKADKKSKLYFEDRVVAIFAEIMERLSSMRKTQQIIINKLDSLEKKIDKLGKRFVWAGDVKGRS